MPCRARWDATPTASCRRRSPTSASTPAARRPGRRHRRARTTVCTSASATASRSTPSAGPALPGSGAGLLGLQERVDLAGGTLVHGPDGSGDFVVDAELPVVTIRVLLVDDDALVRAGLRIILSSAEDLEVVGEADDGAGAVAAVREHRPDVVLMDIRMAEMDGITATAALRRLDRPPQVIVLTTFQADEQVMSALRAGASGFLVKDTPPAEIINAVRVVASGDAIISPSVTRTLLVPLRRRPGIRTPPRRRPATRHTHRPRT